MTGVWPRQFPRSASPDWLSWSVQSGDNKCVLELSEQVQANVDTRGG